MIFRGNVTLTCSIKEENEYFTLYSTNYFGDYQILLGLKSSECYKAYSKDTTYCQCIKKGMLLDLLNIYPNSYSIFVDRAINRRVEFRRIKKQYEKFANVNPDPVVDSKNI